MELGVLITLRLAGDRVLALTCAKLSEVLRRPWGDIGEEFLFHCQICFFRNTT